MAVADAAGTAIATNGYDAWGVPNPTNLGRFQYTGQAWLPEIGMYHFKARVYAPGIGRFLQTDPVGYEDQVNLYTYAANDPVNLTDPSGEFANFILGAAVGIIAEVVVQTIIEGKGLGQLAGGMLVQSAAIGALSGGVGGATAKLAGAAGKAIGGPASAMQRGASKVLTGAATGSVGGATGAAVGDAENQMVNTGSVETAQMGKAALVGAATGGLSGAAKGVAQANASQRALGDARAQTMFTSTQPGAATAAATGAALDTVAGAATAAHNACQQKESSC